MTTPPPQLPELICLTDYGGNWEAYLDALYAAFRADFVVSKPTCGTKPCRLKSHPFVNGKEATFWHFISEGQNEEERVPDLRRCERIRWPRALMDKAGTDEVRCWRQTRRRANASSHGGSEQRFALAVPDFSYVVIVADREDYVLPWTAFCVESERQRKRREMEWQVERLASPW